MTNIRKPFPKGKKPTKAVRPKRPYGRNAGDSEADPYIYGLHPVVHALQNPSRTHHRLLVTANALRRLTEDLGNAPDSLIAGLTIEEASSNQISRIAGDDAVHQGCLLYCDPLPDLSLDDLREPRRLLLLDQVTDPHNVGAVLRSAAAFALDAVVVTTRHSPRLTAVLAKSAAGALDIVPLARVQNLSRALEDLNARGFVTIGLDASASQPLEDIALPGPFALVMGAEGKGLRQKTRETCSALARIDMPGRMPSLNVSNATVLALYITDRNAGKG
ncbi:TrmH family RNA methyltransferase [Microbaculum marinisediminis]|uniref:RNA methyltransferase n=1 Tax=Microbaculum marinisediminis TaxID=2931392 RepID=A0AAW5R688_9HYPH|nr:RNA methyltransferase [Microbaculum sp. A6E488]MCT8974932.1 RNA methyltransferase [Microbaculum sp. A6E488]